MKWLDFGRHIETVTMEQGPDGTYRAASDRVVTREVDVREQHSGCWVMDFLSDFGLVPEDHLLEAEPEPTQKIIFGKNEYDPDQGFWDGYDHY